MNSVPLVLGRSPRLGAVIAFAALVLLVPGGLAQDQATPVGGAQVGDGPHPAHIHSGTCDTLGEVVVPLNDLTGMHVGGSPVATAADMMASPMAGDMGMMSQSSETVVQLPLNDILAAEHAINVHESAENIQNYIACGEITGSPTNGQLTIQLTELNGSGFNGEATLVDNGDGTTTVTATIMQTGGGMASPMATPSM